MSIGNGVRTRLEISGSVISDVSVLTVQRAQGAARPRVVDGYL